MVDVGKVILMEAWMEKCMCKNRAADLFLVTEKLFPLRAFSLE